jgi:hypothetical protein
MTEYIPEGKDFYLGQKRKGTNSSFNILKLEDLSTVWLLSLSIPSMSTPFLGVFTLSYEL